MNWYKIAIKINNIKDLVEHIKKIVPLIIDEYEELIFNGNIEFLDNSFYFEIFDENQNVFRIYFKNDRGLYTFVVIKNGKEAIATARGNFAAISSDSLIRDILKRILNNKYQKEEKYSNGRDNIMNWFKRSKKEKERIPGGRAEGHDSDEYPKDQIQKGIAVEKEHTPDKEVAREIAKDHMAEKNNSNYYDLLDEMEKKLKPRKEKNKDK